MEKKYTAPAIAHGLNILEIISKHEEIGFNKIGEIAKINGNSLNRYLSTLYELGYINKTEDNKYFSGVKLAILSDSVNIYKILKERANKYLNLLEQEFRVTASLFGISFNGNIYCIDKVSSSDNLSMQKVGSYDPGNILCAWGHLYLSTLNTIEDAEQLIYNEYNSYYNQISLDKFRMAQKFTREHGYCDDKLTSKSGLRRIAFPIYNSRKKLIGAITIGSFGALIDDNKAKKITEKLRIYANEISFRGGEENEQNK